MDGMGGKRATRANVTVEILRVEGDNPPKVLHVLRHAAYSLDAVFASSKAVIESAPPTAGANAFRILADDGSEIYSWPHKPRSL
jgi:hypothetical protein